MRNKHIFAIDAVIIAGTLVCLMILIGYASPLVIAPINNLETTNSSVLFSFDKASEILIDDNMEFTSPEKIIAQDNLMVNLKPGIYYWKIKGIRESEIRKITIESEVNLKLKEINESYTLVNAGNENLRVVIYNNTEAIGKEILLPGEEKNVSGTKFMGGLNEI